MTKKSSGRNSKMPKVIINKKKEDNYDDMDLY